MNLFHNFKTKWNCSIIMSCIHSIDFLQSFFYYKIQFFFLLILIVFYNNINKFHLSFIMIVELRIVENHNKTAKYSIFKGIQADVFLYYYYF